MNIILDSNILFSALIKDSVTRRLILEYDGFFLFPEFIFDEMIKHKDELLMKSKMNSGDFNKLLKLLMKKVIIMPNNTIASYKAESLKIIGKIDQNDAIFIACALAYQDSIIWSDDKKLKEQNKVIILNTKEIISFI